MEDLPKDYFSHNKSNANLVTNDVEIGRKPLHRNSSLHVHIVGLLLNLLLLNYLYSASSVPSKHGTTFGGKNCDGLNLICLQDAERVIHIMFEIV